MTEHELRSSRVARLTHGWYTMDPPLDLPARCRAFLSLLPAGSRYSDITAAQLYSLPLPTMANESLHVTVPADGIAPRRHELVVHRRSLEPADLGLHADLPVVAPPRLFLDLAATLGRESLVAVGDAMLRTKLVTCADLLTRVERARRVRGRRRALAVLPLLDGRAASRPETILRLRLHAVGIMFEPQCAVVDASGHILGHVDLGDASSKVGVEYEGRQHAEGEQFQYDIHRYREFNALGWRIIRAEKSDLRNTRRLITLVQDALTRVGRAR